MPTKEYQNKLFKLPIIVTICIVLTIILIMSDPLNITGNKVSITNKHNKSSSLEYQYGMTRGETIALLDYYDGRNLFEPTQKIVQAYDFALKRISIHYKKSQQEVCEMIEYTINKLDDESNIKCSRSKLIKLILSHIKFNMRTGANMTLEKDLETCQNGLYKIKFFSPFFNAEYASLDLEEDLESCQVVLRPLPLFDNEEHIASLDCDNGRTLFPPTEKIIQACDLDLKRISIHYGKPRQEVCEMIEYTINKLDDELNIKCSRSKLLEIIIVGVDSGTNRTLEETLDRLLLLITIDIQELL